MSEQFSEEDERDLQSLFDETAGAPTQDQLHRMARVAAQIPDRTKLPWYARWRSWLPKAAVASAAVAAAAAAVIVTQPDGPAPDVTSPVAVTSTAPVPTTPALPDEPSELDDDLDEELFAGIDDLDIDEILADEEDDDGLLASADVDTAMPMESLDVLIAADDDAGLDLLAEVYDEVVF